MSRALTRAHRIRGVLVVPALLALLGACEVNQTPSIAASQSLGVEASVQRSDMNCFGDNRVRELAFSDVEAADETYDRSGSELTFLRNNGAWHGIVRNANGELGDSLPFVSLGLDDRAGIANFSYMHSNRDTLHFSGRISCDSVWGDWSPYRGVTEQHSYRRVSRSGYIPTAKGR